MKFFSGLNLVRTIINAGLVKLRIKLEKFVKSILPIPNWIEKAISKITYKVLNDIIYRFTVKL